VIEIVGVVVIFIFAKSVGPAARRLWRQFHHAGVSVIRNTSRIILGSSLPSGAVVLELHRDGSVWLIAKAPGVPDVARNPA
jgi:hypothetical protein